MGTKKYEIEQKHVDGYINYLEKKKEGYRLQLSKIQRLIDSIDLKIRAPEKSLRKDLAEGVKAASFASGIPLQARATAAPDDVSAPAPTLKDEPKPEKKKSGWEGW